MRLGKRNLLIAPVRKQNWTNATKTNQPVYSVKFVQTKGTSVSEMTHVGCSLLAFA